VLAMTGLGCPSPRENEAEMAIAPSATRSDAVILAAGKAEEISTGPRCPASSDPTVGVMTSPERVVSGEPFRVVAAALGDESPLSLQVYEGDRVLAGEFSVRPGVPSAVIGGFERAPAGSMRVAVERGSTVVSCTNVVVAKTPGSDRPPLASRDRVWPIDRAWSPSEEALFSAWVRELFHAERGAELAWKALDEVTSIAARNLLHDHFGWHEDSPDPKVGLDLEPDCADTPYFLRGYYAWKRRLPFGFRACSRGEGRAPKCGRLRGVLGPPEDPPEGANHELAVVQRYFRRTLAWGVHSGNGRAALADDESDFYPVELSRAALRPGVIYADPYGHLFVLVELMPPDGSSPGILYAIDGQPDGSITRKRFWEGNFLWNPDPALGGSGFKGFRPTSLVGSGSPRLATPSNRDLGNEPGYADVSVAQGGLGAAEFYDRMDALITPGTRDPIRALEEAVTALHEAAKVRVTSVGNAEEFFTSHTRIPMPSGHAIFETTGPWEDFSTPARDLRLLIAIDLVLGFEDKVARNQDVFRSAEHSPKELRDALAGTRARLLADPAFELRYERSDGSQWTLRLADVIARVDAFEIGYNPNDCPEVRWGAPTGSPERSTCRRRAPDDQHRKMLAYRHWFKSRRRPSRGDPGPPVD